MAEYVYDEVQIVPAGGACMLQDSIPCQKGYIVHNNGEANTYVRGIVGNPCQRFAQYKVGFEADIAVAEGGTPGAISLAIAVNGEVIPVSIATVTPTAAEAYFHVSGQKTLRVPAGCCFTVTIDNNSDQDIQVQHLNVPINRKA